MSGAITQQDGTRLVGWAMLRGDASYHPVVHLVQDNVILASVIADGIGDEPAEDVTEQRGHWFRFDLDDLALSESDALRIVVGETGEMFGDAPDGDCEGEAFTFRHALAVGLTAEDVVNGFYLDFLRRPADEPALAHFRLKAKAELAASIERWRKGLLDSDEYKRGRRRTRDGVGRIFASTILPRTSRRVRESEACLPAFLAATSPLDERLTCFFPGLHLRGDARDRVKACAAAGLPEREIFFRALACLADRPALLLPPNARGDDASTSNADALGSDVTALPCRSPRFTAGWHKVEIEAEQEHRWMDQIGVIGFPPDGVALRRIEIVIDGTYGDVGHLVAASESTLLRTELATGGNDTQLVITADGEAPFRLRRLVLLAEYARCPWHVEGQPDPRLLSIRVREARLIQDLPV